MRWCSLGQTKLLWERGTAPSSFSWENLDPRVAKMEILRSRGQAHNWGTDQRPDFSCRVRCNKGNHKWEQSRRKEPVLRGEVVKRKNYSQGFSFLFFCNSFKSSPFKNCCIWSCIPVKRSTEISRPCPLLTTHIIPMLNHDILSFPVHISSSCILPWLHVVSFLQNRTHQEKLCPHSLEAVLASPCFLQVKCQPLCTR